MTTTDTDLKPTYITIVHAAEILGKSHWTIRRWVHQGILPAKQLGGRGKHWLIDLEDVNQLIDHQGAVLDQLDKKGAEKND